ncbi:MAG: hypothetical protein ACR2IQ_01825 [Minisyncoccia bacterium]
MKNNNLYNMMHQLTQEQKSLWRLEGDYKKDAAKNQTLKKFWATLAKEKQQHIDDLTKMIKAEMK